MTQRTPGFICFFISLVLVLWPATPSRAQEVSLDIHSTGLDGRLRYGRWAGMTVKIQPGEDRSSFSGTLRISGASGFRLEQAVSLTRNEQHTTVRVPIFCSSSFPVYTLRLLDPSGTELVRKQRRFRRILPPGQTFIGLSTSLGRSARDRIRRSWKGDRVVFGQAARGRLLEAAGWPGLLDVVYLQSPAENTRAAEATSVRVYKPGQSLQTSTSLDPRTALVDPRAYDLFERPDVSRRRRNWFRRGLWIQLFVLFGVFSLGLWMRSPRRVWGTLMVLPVGLAVFFSWTAPEKPEMIRQTVTVQYFEEGTERGVIDQLVGLYPYAVEPSSEEGKAGKKKATAGNLPEDVPVSYPLQDLRRSMPLFFRESSLKERFPLVRRRTGTWQFHWSSFPARGYFVTRHVERTDPGAAPISVTRLSGGIRIENRSARAIRQTWIIRDGQFIRVGYLAPGGSGTGDPASPDGIRSARGPFLKDLFDPDTRRDRVLRRTVKRMLDRVPADGTYVIGLTEGEVLNTAPGTTYEDRVFPAVMLYRLEDR